MSGIAAIFNLDGAPADRTIVDRMLAAIPYRGIDGTASWSDGPVALGHATLHTTPESIGESQPLLGASGNVALIFAGRIDNREELIGALAGEDRLLHTDTEIVLEAYERWGEDFLGRVLGDFAFALWDRRRRRMLCARDPLGVAAFYYYIDARVFICGSELHQLFVHPGVPRAPNEPMIAEVLEHSAQDAEETLYRGIYRLPGAFALSVTSHGANKRRYYDVDPSRSIEYSSDDEYADHFRSLFRDAVRCRLRATGGVVADLSGGLDSTSVVLVARELLQSQTARVDSFDAISMTFERPEANEEQYIAEAEKAGNFCSQRVKRLLQRREQCLAAVRHYRDVPDPPNLAMFDAAALAATLGKSRVWLTGVGGDDFLSGSAYIYADLIRGLNLPSIVRRLRSDYDRFAHDRSGQNPLLGLYRGGLLPLVPRRVRRALKPYFKSADVLRVVTSDFARRTGLVERTQRHPPSPSFRELAQVELHSTYTAGARLYMLETIDRFAAHHGLEARHPFYDRRLLEFIFAIPEDQRMRGGLTKFVLRRAMEGALPPAILGRRDKADFAYVYPETLRGAGDESLFDSLSIARAGWIDGERTRREYLRMRALYEAGNLEYENSIGRLWNVFAIDLWFSQTFERASGFASTMDVESLSQSVLSVGQAHGDATAQSSSSPTGQPHLKQT